ncbi:Testis-expressed protein 9 [Holothuria leucospilota]|uniref:Testis-expressed protein 9 n=1 Tax=Holothuria leucospilota TaxID=206669 RepID=A0A9Q1H721_HOLLE|nr:Testis-expressed protein 9 [Holothuria leucospilota]
MREQESILNHSFNRLDLEESLEDKGQVLPVFETEPQGVSDDISKPSLITASNLDKRPPSRSRPNTAGSARGQSAKTAGKSKKRPKSRTLSAASAADDVAIPSQEATIRFLKAKLRVMQEELDSLSQECNQKEEANIINLPLRIKELEDEQGRLNRTHQNQVSQMRNTRTSRRGKKEK